MRAPSTRPTSLSAGAGLYAVLGLVAVLLSTYWLADGMRGGEIDGCPVDVGRR